MGKLKDPSRELAKKVLTEVDFEHRLNGFSLKERMGAMPVALYSFQEVVSLLNERHPRLDFKELEEWIRRTMGDKELARQIAEAVTNGRSDQDRLFQIKQLMEERLGQCKELTGRT